MNILVALDSFKGSLSSRQANAAVKKGLLNASDSFRVATIPVADGGEGTIDALVSALGGRVVYKTVCGPLRRPVKAAYGIIHQDTTAVIEVAEACGLPLVNEEDRNALSATSYGVGELIVDALEKGCREMIIGLGGSAVTDGGTGMLRALGFQFLDADGRSIGDGGGQLSRLAHIDTTHVHPRLNDAVIQTMCDVSNPLYGPNGSAHIFAPQKGASPEEVSLLDEGLQHFAAVVQKQLGLDLQDIAGSGAAGGLGAAFSGFLQSSLQSGVQFILDEVKVDERIAEADLIITGEGKLDAQSSMGKAPSGIAERAKQQGRAVIALAGDITAVEKTLHGAGIDACFSIMRGPSSLQDALNPDTARDNLAETSEQIGRLLTVKKGGWA
ncbi:glycerate kinase [Halobacillus kuroshimensis]|uniref:Glycerate kinase n=1 Tax=Halobacillus kuroshimensis TaxID=302481 RepID=A0ABS3DUR2_9BACI|nr:glycerate kinase [Halobacillus kuroshimensis]MBN8235062.1 glycerate kinase [Halobacillus kuroshimensis]